MNRIVLIGNGFDLAHGLPTRYEDFINDYWNGYISEAFLKVGGFDKDGIKLTLSAANYSLSKIFNSKQPQGYGVLKDFIREYAPNTTLSIKNKFFKHISDKSTLNNWVDVENEYYKILCNKVKKVPYHSYTIYEDVRKLHEDFDFVKCKLNEYLLKIRQKHNIQRSNKIQEIIYSSFFIGEFTEDGKNDIIANECQKIDEYRRTSNPDILSPRTITLLNFQPNLDAEFLTIKAIDKVFWKDFFDFYPDDIMFLNFNYTNLEELYIDKLNPVNKKFIPLNVHIHGELNNPKNPIIFGYGDELEEYYNQLENLQDNAYLENIKSIKYQETDNYKQMLNFVNSDKYQIIILGHSCGNSDRTLLNTLFEHENCVSIKPYYYQYEENGVINDNYSDIVRNISRCFTDKKSMRDKVVNKTYTDCFASKRT